MLRRIFSAARDYFNGGPEEPSDTNGETLREGSFDQPPAGEEPEQGPRPLDLPPSTLVGQFERRAVADAMRHEEDLFVQEIPIVAEVERLAEERLAGLRRWADERCQEIESGRAAVSLRRERAEQALASAEAALLRHGVADDELALPEGGVAVKRVVASAALALLVVSLVAVPKVAAETGVRMPVAAAVMALVVVGAVLIAVAGDENRKLRKVRGETADLLDELTLREGELNRELREMPERVLTLAEAETVLPARLVTAYRSTVLRALPPGALRERREFPDNSLPHVEVPEWAASYDPTAERSPHS